MNINNNLLHNNDERKPTREMSFTGKYCFKIMFVILFAFMVLSPAGVHAQAATGKTVAPQAAQEVVYPAAQFDDGMARFYVLKTTDGAKIKYFIIKSSDGVIRAAFDTCVVCWREGKGYTQKDDFMVCNNCGRRFQSTKINEVTGGCNPAPLTRKTENGKVIIKIENLLEGKQFFARGGK
jgi:uncharacterized membrane protein